MFRRPAFETGEVLHGAVVGIGNALMKREVLLELDGPFRPQLWGRRRRSGPISSSYGRR